KKEVLAKKAANTIISTTTLVNNASSNFTTPAITASNSTLLYNSRIFIVSNSINNINFY
ncbi:hypothetical protein QBC45DRAFT_335949, partial [Copromyces sp. CBS 386.78]